jgi:Ca2+-binding RTX toxin-like protein
VQLTTDPCDQTKTALQVLGGGGNDIITITKAGTNIVQVTVNGLSLGIYSPTGFIIVDGRNGNDSITVDAQVSQPRILYGSAGNDTLRGGNGTGILIGGDGNDSLDSGNGRDILIGGNGADTMVNGGNGDDMLIAGRTSYDDRTTANQQALCGIRTEWVRTDAGYQVRINHLTGVTPGGLNGTSYLKGAPPGQTVFDDSGLDQLRGRNGDDWFLLNLSGGTVLDTHDRTGPEVATDIQ